MKLFLRYGALFWALAPLPSVARQEAQEEGQPACTNTCEAGTLIVSSTICVMRSRPGSVGAFRLDRHGQDGPVDRHNPGSFSTLGHCTDHLHGAENHDRVKTMLSTLMIESSQGYGHGPSILIPASIATGLDAGNIASNTKPMLQPKYSGNK